MLVWPVLACAALAAAPAGEARVSLDARDAPIQDVIGLLAELRVAKASRLAEEAAARRRLDEERAQGGPDRIALFRLSYARAEALAPLLKSRLPPGSQIAWDARTNTLIVTTRP